MTDKKDDLKMEENFVDEHNHDHDEDMDIIYLDLEDEGNVECGILGIFEVEGKEYMALWAIEDDEVLLFEYEEMDDEFELTSIDDEEEFELVSQGYYELFSDDGEDELD